MVRPLALGRDRSWPMGVLTHRNRLSPPSAARRKRTRKPFVLEDSFPASLIGHLRRSRLRPCFFYPFGERLLSPSYVDRASYSRNWLFCSSARRVPRTKWKESSVEGIFLVAGTTFEANEGVCILLKPLLIVFAQRGACHLFLP